MENTFYTGGVPAAAERIARLQHRQDSISRALSALFKTKNTALAINGILADILQQFPKGRVYVMEYDKAVPSHICRFQASDGYDQYCYPMGFPMLTDRWWRRQIAEQGEPLRLDSLQGMPEEAKTVRKVLERQGIQSMIAFPLFSRDGLWGCAGLDLFGREYAWSGEDCQWLASMANVIGICVEFQRSENQVKSEKQYSANLYKHMPIGYIRLRLLYDSRGKITDYVLMDANEMYFKIFGDEATPIGMEISKTGWLHREHLTDFHRLVNEGGILSQKLFLEKQHRHCTCVGYMPREHEVVFLVTDVTDSYLTHQALKKSERLLKNIYRYSPVGIELYDKEGYLVDVNAKNMEIFGLKSKKDVLGINIFKNPIMPEEIKRQLKKREDANFLLSYDFDKLNGYYETLRTGKISLLTKITTLEDEHGDLANYLMINVDRTEEAIAFNRIEEFQDFFKLVGEFAKVGYAHFDALTCDGEALSSWYRNVGEREGRPLPQIINVYEHLYEEDRKMLQDFLAQVVRGERQRLQTDVRILREDGTLGWTRINMMVRNYDPGSQDIEMLCINFDITELKNTEERLRIAKEHAEESDKLKSAFIANMSHEIRTPLNAILGFSSLLAETDNPRERAEYLEIVEKNNELLLQLISDILDLSKMEAGILDLTWEELDAGKLCSDVVKTLQQKTPNGVSLVVENAGGPCLFVSDGKRLQQVLINLVSNAQKFTSQGEIRITYQKTERSVEFTVQDTGIGIAPENLPKTFQRFVKFNPFIHGTGLGLSICRNIIGQLGGEIGVESEYGTGSRFWFRVPVAPETE